MMPPYRAVAAYFLSLSVFCVSLVFPLSAQAAKALPSPEQLVKQLDESKDARLDIELKTGKSFLRCKLLGVVRGSGKGLPKALRVQEGEEGKTVSLNFASIRSLTIDREKVYEAAGSGKLTGKEALAAKRSQAEAEENAKWLAKAQENKVRVWQDLSREEHEKAIEEHREMIAKVKQAIPEMELYETHEFMFCSNMPRNQVIPYAASLDKMHDMMCTMYRIKQGTPIWRGKCLVMAFLDRAQFHGFEAEFYKSKLEALSNIYGLCHQSSNGRVVISCYRGNDPNDFGQMLVHETSHGFIFRYRTMVQMPKWVNEGMAEWIGQSLVPGSTAVKRKEKHAFQVMQMSRSLNGLFTVSPFEGVYYGMASSLTDFLISTDEGKYAEFIDGIKQGKDWEQSLKDAYDATPQQLATAYGRAIGIPDLRL